MDWIAFKCANLDTSPVLHHVFSQSFCFFGVLYIVNVLQLFIAASSFQFVQLLMIILLHCKFPTQNVTYTFQSFVVCMYKQMWRLHLCVVVMVTHMRIDDNSTYVCLDGTYGRQCFLETHKLCNKSATSSSPSASSFLFQYWFNWSE